MRGGMRATGGTHLWVSSKTCIQTGDTPTPTSHERMHKQHDTNIAPLKQLVKYGVDS